MADPKDTRAAATPAAAPAAAAPAAPSAAATPAPVAWQKREYRVRHRIAGASVARGGTLTLTADEAKQYGDAVEPKR